ncbi:MAG TPA: hypothetical protein VKU02_29420 [Gemmataceae bacterium]|nr:hypothetical protein [Gemmataceae bacterium]
MNVFRKLWLAIENLASSLNWLAATIDSFNQEIVQRSGIRVDVGPLLSSNGSTGLAEMPVTRKRKTAP